MTWTLLYQWTCDVCGVQVTTADSLIPAGWASETREYAPHQYRDRDYCPACSPPPADARDAETAEPTS